MVLKATQWRRLAIFQNQFRRKDTVTHLFLGHNPTALGETKNVSFRGASQHHIFPQVSNKKYLRKKTTIFEEYGNQAKSRGARFSSGKVQITAGRKY
ncbi:hypothetical protein TNCT_15421 [Trichonephila clavata]|uniref:Uncharacterized protein n=1 Tax=Trichonephila clavata TaxID=2740835 RepID=A0A8X6GVX1_TRICU|nr:hypothetical protein TNCT_15421 [Trichonephila clavata]